MVGTSLLMPFDLQRPFQTKDDMHRRIAGGGLFNDDLRVSAVKCLLQTCEESADAFALGGDEPVGFITGNSVMINRQGHEEKM